MYISISSGVLCRSGYILAWYIIVHLVLGTRLVREQVVFSLILYDASKC